MRKDCKTPSRFARGHACQLFELEDVDSLNLTFQPMIQALKFKKNAVAQILPLSNFNDNNGDDTAEAEGRFELSRFEPRLKDGFTLWKILEEQLKLASTISTVIFDDFELIFDDFLNIICDGVRWFLMILNCFRCFFDGYGLEPGGACLNFGWSVGPGGFGATGRRPSQLGGVTGCPVALVFSALEARITPRGISTS